MASPARITGPLLDVLELLLRSSAAGDDDVHGWALMKATKRSGPTVYGVLDRLEDSGWISGRWEESNPDPGKPRRRFYRLTPAGVTAARQILSERRPQALRPAAGTVLPGWRHAPRQAGAS